MLHLARACGVQPPARASPPSALPDRLRRLSQPPPIPLRPRPPTRTAWPRRWPPSFPAAPATGSSLSPPPTSPLASLPLPYPPFSAAATPPRASTPSSCSISSTGPQPASRRRHRPPTPLPGLLDQMIRDYPTPPLVLSSVHRALCASDQNGWPAVLDMLVDTCKKTGRVRDGAEVVLLMKDLGLAPSLRCCNGLLKDLLRAEALDMLWKVRGFMEGAGISPDVYTYSTLIEAYCKVRDLEAAKKVVEEMRETGCSLNVVTYNTLIGGLCRTGAVEEAFGYKKEMEDYGLVPDGFTYGAIINGLCKRGRPDQAKCLLDEMSCAGLMPNVVVYSTLIDGFMRQGNADETLR